MIVLGADKPPQTNPDSQEHRAQLARYAGRIGEELESSYKVVYAGTVTTTTIAAVTVFETTGAVLGDQVFMFPSDAVAAAMAGVYGVVVDTGGGVIGVAMAHPNQGPTGRFSVMVVSV